MIPLMWSLQCEQIELFSYLGSVYPKNNIFPEMGITELFVIIIFQITCDWKCLCVNMWKCVRACVRACVCVSKLVGLRACGCLSLLAPIYMNLNGHIIINQSKRLVLLPIIWQQLSLPRLMYTSLNECSRNKETTFISIRGVILYFTQNLMVNLFQN